MKEKLSYAGVAVSIVLFLLKLWAGYVSGSIAVMSDALNSFLDVFSYTAILIAVRVQAKAPDLDHQFGHKRAEPLAGFLIAVMAVILGFNVLKDAVTSFFDPKQIKISTLPFVTMIVSVALKALMTTLYTIEGRSTGSPAMRSAAVDSRNDILASSTALLGFFLSGVWDGLAAAAIGGWILYSGVRMGFENTGYLIGKAPDRIYFDRARETALSVPGVKGVNDIRSHFVGNVIDIEIHIEVDKDLKIGEAHDIGYAVRNKLGELPDIGSVFVHIDVEGDPTRLPELET